MGLFGNPGVMPNLQQPTWAQALGIVVSIFNVICAPIQIQEL